MDLRVVYNWGFGQVLFEFAPNGSVEWIWGFGWDFCGCEQGRTTTTSW